MFIGSKKTRPARWLSGSQRLVIQLFSQREGIDYDETFALVAKVITFRLMLNLLKVLNLEIHQFNVDSAFFIRIWKRMCSLSRHLEWI